MELICSGVGPVKARMVLIALNSVDGASKSVALASVAWPIDLLPSAVGAGPVTSSLRSSPVSYVGVTVDCADCCWVTSSVNGRCGSAAVASVAAAGVG